MNGVDFFSRTESDPVTVVAGWKIFRVKGQLVANCPEDASVWVQVADGEFRLSDFESYYPGGRYDVPLGVIDALQGDFP